MLLRTLIPLLVMLVPMVALCGVRNRPGVLFLSFDGGNHTGLQSLKQVLNDDQFCLSPTDMIESPLAGDSPPDDLVMITPNPFSNPHPPFGQVMRMAFMTGSDVIVLK